jgi:uncharacterized protein YcfJ
MRRSTFHMACVLALGSVAGLLATSASAQEVGRVISSTPMISQVSVPRQVCSQEEVQVQSQTPPTKSGAGALMGAVAGGAVGNAVGNGNGRVAATILGFVGGAILGDRVEGGTPGQVATSQQTVNRCSTQNFYENRTTGYQVVYEYAGKQYSVQLPQDPGPTIQLQVTPTAQPAQTAPPAPVSQAPAPAVSTTVITSSTEYQPAVVYSAPVVVAAPYYYPQPALGTSFVIRAGNGYGYAHPGYHRNHYPAYFR